MSHAATSADGPHKLTLPNVAKDTLLVVLYLNDILIEALRLSPI
jgi:hypothetical protein